MSKTSPETPSFSSTTPPHRSQLSLLASPVSSNSIRQRLGSSTGDDSVSRNSSSDFERSVFMNNDIAKDNVEPWEAFKWTPLIKVSDQLYSHAIKQESGLVSVMVVSGVIAIGTTRSLIFVYDYSQNLKCILGDSTRGKIHLFFFIYYKSISD